MIAYSGLIVGRGKETDYRNARSIAPYKNKLPEFCQLVKGQYAVMYMNRNYFTCYADNLGSYKVFYCTMDTGEVFVTNHLPFLDMMKDREVNYQFLTNWIATVGTYGYETIDKRTFALPEFGSLYWDTEIGLKIERYKSFESYAESHLTLPELHQKVADNFRSAAEYMATYHNSVIPLSCGFDSRLILNMFWNCDKTNLKSFTFPEVLEDKVIPKKLCRDHQISHAMIYPEGMPTLEELHDFNVSNLYPFYTYGYLLNYVHDAPKEPFSGYDSVFIKGAAGHTDFGLKFMSEKNSGGEELIENLSNKLIHRKLLTYEAENDTFLHTKNHYARKYLFAEEDEFRLKLPAGYHYYFERLAAFQGQYYMHEWRWRDLFQPYGDEDFIKLVLQANQEILIRENVNSIHHKLHLLLTDGRAKKISFEKMAHWDKSTFYKSYYSVRARYAKKIIRRIGINTEKLTNTLKTNFAEQNKDYLEEILNSYPNSNIWDYIDKSFIEKVFEDESGVSYLKNSGYLYKIAPYLREGY